MKKLAVLMLALSVSPALAGNGASTKEPIFVAPATCAEVQTEVVLAAGVSAQLVAASTKRNLRWQNIGTNPMTVVPGTTAAVVGHGFQYNGASGAGNGGGAEAFNANTVPTNAFQAVSTAGTTVEVWVCN